MPSSIPERSREFLLSRLLNVYWLRPESALWYAHMLYEAQEFLREKCDPPLLDFGCMDSVNSFILSGGELQESFDVYKRVSWDKESHKTSIVQYDYFDRPPREDEGEVVRKEPLLRWDYGIDWKSTHIAQSKALGLHQKYVLINLSKPHIPLGVDTVETVWAPNIYWSPNIDKVLKELSRIVRVTGQIICIGPDRIQLEYMLFRLRDKFGEAWLKDLDRGRHINITRHARSLSEWESLFKSNGLTISAAKRFIPPIVAQCYDLGFRPFFPVFMNMYERISSFSADELLDLKRSWTDTEFDLLGPMCTNKLVAETPTESMAWHIFVLSPSGE